MKELKFIAGLLICLIAGIFILCSEGNMIFLSPKIEIATNLQSC